MALEAPVNIFVLDSDPVLAAQAQLDKHSTKMVLETAQLLCGAFPQGVAPYRRTHYTHPCAIWTRQSIGNFRWLVEHGLALADEFEFRFKKSHKSRGVILWCAENEALAELPDRERTPFALAMPDEFKRVDPVEAYRAYYRGAKAEIARWAKGRAQPSWWAPVAE